MFNSTSYRWHVEAFGLSEAHHRSSVAHLDDIDRRNGIPACYCYYYDRLEHIRCPEFNPSYRSIPLACYNSLNSQVMAGDTTSIET